MRKKAKKLKLTTVSDLKKIAHKLKIGGPPECAERPFCLGSASQKLYGLKFAQVLKLDAGGPDTRAALESGRIDVGVLFTASSVIPKDAVLLRDDKALQPADNPVLVLRKDAATPRGARRRRRRVGRGHHGRLPEDVTRSERQAPRPGRRRRHLPRRQQSSVTRQHCRMSG